jgi:hypothetical protein
MFISDAIINGIITIIISLVVIINIVVLLPLPNSLLVLLSVIKGSDRCPAMNRQFSQN